jgi:hypothetical protein
LPRALKKKRNLRKLNLDLAYLTLSWESLANIQNGLNKVFRVSELTLFFYKNKCASSDFEAFFDGLRGFEKLEKLELNLARYQAI